MARFRFALILENDEPADPAFFSTLVPSWRVGDTFFAGRGLRCFRILDIERTVDTDSAETVDAVWIVEPVRLSP